MKKYYCIILVICFFACISFGGDVNAQSDEEYEIDGFVYKILDNGNIVIVDYEYGGCDDVNVQIPEVIEGHIVEEIGERALYYNGKMETVTIPSTVIRIGEYAFGSWIKEFIVHKDNPIFASPEGVLYNIAEMELVDYPRANEREFYEVLDGTRTIGAGAFEENLNLKEVILPDSVTKIEEYAFLFCDNTYINFPENLEYIGDSAFRGCKAIPKINLPKNVHTIGQGALSLIPVSEFEVSEDNPYLTVKDGVIYSRDMKRLIAYPYAKENKVYTVPEGVLEIGPGAFMDCESLLYVEFPESLEKIGGQAFIWGNIVSITIPEKVAVIEAGAFDSCEQLEKVILPEGLTEIKRTMFFGCDKLRDIVIPETVEKIGDQAFDCCPSLAVLRVPANISNLDQYVFDDDTELIVDRNSYALDYARKH